MHYDILLAIDLCSNHCTVKWAKAWLEALEQGAEPKTSLADGYRSEDARMDAIWIWERSMVTRE